MPSELSEVKKNHNKKYWTVYKNVINSRITGTVNKDGSEYIININLATNLICPWNQSIQRISMLLIISTSCIYYYVQHSVGNKTHFSVFSQCLMKLKNSDQWICDLSSIQNISTQGQFNHDPFVASWQKLPDCHLKSPGTSWIAWCCVFLTMVS